MESQLGERPIWEPTHEQVEAAQLTRFMRWLADNKGLVFADYHALHAWSVRELQAFWAAMFEYFDIESPTPHEKILEPATMPGARWFAGARVNFARHVLRAGPADRGLTAIVSQTEGGRVAETSWAELEDMVERLAVRMRELGVGPGDHVAAYATSTPETIAAFLAAAAVGAVFASVSPEFGVAAARDRFVQISPRLLFAVSGYRYGGKWHDRVAEVAEIAGALPGLAHVVQLPSEGRAGADGAAISGAIPLSELLAGAERSAFAYAEVEFDHPLFVGFSSGTTGLPKATVTGHGGVTIEAYKLAVLHGNLDETKRLFAFSTTGWIVWTMSVAQMVSGASLVLFSGNPLGPDPDALWRLAADARATSFTAGSAFMNAAMSRGVKPGEAFDLSAMESLCFGGSPASPETMRWIAEAVGGHVSVQTASGGTEIFTCLVGYCPILPSYAGEFQCRWLGVDAVAMADDGQALIDEVGELVVRQPLPTMPLAMVGDPEGERLRATYFDRFPGYWRHGDFFLVNARGGSVISGRSDATLNRHGVRIGTAEIYRILEAIPGLADSMVVNLELGEGGSFMPLFVAPSVPGDVDEHIVALIAERLRSEGSPRHVPDVVVAVPDIPYTISGKKLEVPVKRILMGVAPDKAANRASMRNPESLDFFAHYARELPFAAVGRAS